MLKSVSSITNTLGALNYRGTWDATANSPTLTSSVGTKGDYYVVGTAGTTALNGVSNWGIGDWVTFNGSAWQRVEGGADLNGVNLSVSGTSTLSGLTASTALALNASKEVVSVTNTGTGNNVLASSPSITTPSITGDATLSTGNLILGTSGKGIDFSATSGAGTSELFSDYEEGSWSPAFITNTIDLYSLTSGSARYTKIGRIVHIEGVAVFSAGPPSGGFVIPSLPFSPSADSSVVGQFSIGDNGDGYFRDGPSGNWVQNGMVYALAYGNNAAVLWNGIAATDKIGFSFTYSV